MTLFVLNKMLINLWYWKANMCFRRMSVFRLIMARSYSVMSRRLFVAFRDLECFICHVFNVRRHKKTVEGAENLLNLNQFD